MINVTGNDMKFEKLERKTKWKYELSFSVKIKQNGKGKEIFQTDDDKDLIHELEFWLKYNSTGDWKRFRNIVYFNDLNDAYRVRMIFNSDIDVVRYI